MKWKKVLAGVLATAMLVPSVAYASPPVQQTTEKATAVEDGLLIDFDMDTMEGRSILNKADNRAYVIEGTEPSLVESKEGHGKALHMDGKTNYANLGKDYQVTGGETTIAAWVKVDSRIPGMGRIFGRGRTAVSGEKELSLYVRKNGNLEAQCPEWSESGAGQVKLDEWQHVAVSNDGVSQKLYINGNMVSSAGAAGPEGEWNLDLLLGTCWNTEGTAPFAGHLFMGDMDEVKLYSRALSQDEIRELADVETEGGEDGNVELPDALYEFTMDAIEDGTGELTGKKVITSTDGTEYPIYGGAKVDDYGIYDKSILFNGTDSYVNIGRPDINNTYTMSAWIYLENGAANSLNKIWGRDRTTVGDRMFYIAVRGDSGREGTVDVALDGGGVGAPAGTVPFGQWVNFAVTNTPQKSCLYIDGELVATGGGSSVDQRTHPLDMLIGCGYNADGSGIFNGHAFKGRMDDIRIYNEALTAAQIKKNTEGILDKLPPEINVLTPEEDDLLSVEGKLTVEYNMTVSMGEEKPQILDEDNHVVASEVSLEDKNDAVEGTETLVVRPAEKLKSGKAYTYKIPAGTVVNSKGIGNLEQEWTFLVMQDFAGDAANSDLDYWASKGVDIPSEITEKDGKLIMTNGLVERVFDLEDNFLTVSYKNLYTGIELLNKADLQSDASIVLNKEYADNSTDGDQKFYIGGTNEDAPVFQYTGYTVEKKTEEPFHWEWDERISPDSMKDTPWPAKGKALVVTYQAPEGTDPAFANVKVEVRYEIYDGIPSISKTINVTNNGTEDVIVDKMEVEVLPVPVGLRDALYVEGTMNSGNENHDRNNGKERYKQWEDVDGKNGRIISRYAVPAMDNSIVSGRGYDVNNIGPNYRLKSGETFYAYKLYQMFYSNSYFEWQMMEVKKMYRVLFPQTTDAPLIYHLISSNTERVKEGIDQAHNAGFNMVLLSFGSGANVEDISEANIAKYKELCDYAHSKGMLLGSYVMQAARGGDETFQGCWGTMRCMNSPGAHQTLENTLTFIDRTGLDCLEIDGIYPGAVCTHTDHKGHEGVEDAQVKQWEYAVRDFCKELRERNVYINAPDWNFTVGASMAVMGYIEPGFNVTPWRQLIYGREMAYYGTFEKVPAMGWTLVPLSPYQGGSDSSFWPYDEKIMAYDFMIGMNMMYGITGSYRGGNGLYQGAPSQNVIETWGEFYNKYKDILGESVVHIAPPLATSNTSLTTKAIDGIIHADADGVQKGLAALFNQTTETVTQKVKIPLYYTGLTELKTPPAPVKGSHYRASTVVVDLIKMPEVPEIPDVEAVPTDAKVYVCIGDMNGKEYTIDSNGNIEVELTLEPNTYTWLTVYDPENVPEEVANKVTIPVPENAAVKALETDHVMLTWDAVQMNGRDVKEYHIYRDGEYLDKTFTNEFKDTTVQTEQEYEYEIKAVHNTVAGEAVSVQVSTKADHTAPKALSAKASDKNSIIISFNEFLDAVSAGNAANYQIADHQIVKAELQKDRKTVVLTLEKELTAFAETTLTVNGVKDLAGNTAEETALKFEFGYLGEFKFEETDGSTAENTKGDIDGSIQGEVKRAEGISGQSLVLDGKSSYVDAGDILKNRAEYSIAGWFKADETEGIQVLAGRERDSYDGNKWKLFVENATLKFVMNNGKGAYPGHEADGEVVVSLESAAGAVQSGKWQQFAVVQNGDYAALYLDGKPAAEDTAEGVSENLTAYTTWFGAMRNNAGGEPTQNFKGSLDEFTVYNTALTADKVKELYEELRTEKDTYTVTVVNGTGSGKYAYNAKVTVAADAPEVGMKFAGWKAGEIIVSTEAVYTFYASNEMTLEAVYVAEGEAVEQNAQALLTNVITEKRDDNKYNVKFVGQLVLPEGYTVKEAGLVWSSKDGMELAVGGDAKTTYIKRISDTNQFSVTIKGMPGGNFLRGKVFAKIADENGNVQDYIYSLEDRAVTVK